MADMTTDERYVTWIRPFATGLSWKTIGEVPSDCVKCTITFTDGRFRLKYHSSACPVHYKYTRMYLQQTPVHFEAGSESEGETRQWKGTKTRRVRMPRHNRTMAPEKSAEHDKKDRIQSS